MSNSLLFIDWDDTLFPTSWVNSNNINLNANKSIFKSLDSTILKLIKELVRHGKLVIVTNASYKWIKISMETLPKTRDYIKDSKIKVISARYFYQDNHPEIYMWKKKAFKDIVGQILHPKKHQHIVSIGDAMYEYDALIELCDTKNRILKTVRFINSPSYVVLIDQIKLLTTTISNICDKEEFVDVYMKL